VAKPAAQGTVEQQASRVEVPEALPEKQWEARAARALLGPRGPRESRAVERVAQVAQVARLAKERQEPAGKRDLPRRFQVFLLLMRPRCV